MRNRLPMNYGLFNVDPRVKNAYGFMPLD